MLPSAEKVGEDHHQNSRSDEEGIDSIIAWRTAYAVRTGFVTGISGIDAMHISIPTGFSASYALGANTTAAIAYLGGCDFHSEQTRIIVRLCLMKEAAKEILKTAGIVISDRVFGVLLRQIPGRPCRYQQEGGVPSHHKGWREGSSKSCEAYSIYWWHSWRLI